MKSKKKKIDLKNQQKKEQISLNILFQKKKLHSIKVNQKQMKSNAEMQPKK